MAGSHKRFLLLLLACSLITAPLLVRAAEDADDITDVETESSDADYEDDEEDANRAYIVVRKVLPDPPRVVLGSNISVTVEIYNAGKSSAKSVSFRDSTGDKFDFLEGELALSVNALAPGATRKVSYVAVAKTAGMHYLPPVTVKYVSADDDSKLVTTNVPKALYVMTSTENIVATALKVGSYATLGSIQTKEQWKQVAFGAGGVAAVVALFFGYNTIRDANKRWKYQRALKEVEKMQ